MASVHCLHNNNNDNNDNVGGTDLGPGEPEVAAVARRAEPPEQPAHDPLAADCVSQLSNNNNADDDNSNDTSNVGDVPAGPIQSIDRSLASVHCPMIMIIIM